jgi:hypothetical protein
MLFTARDLSLINTAYYRILLKQEKFQVRSIIFTDLGFASENIIV